MAESSLWVHNLHVQINGMPVVNGVDLRVGRGEIHVLMGPNGSGKSTLAAALMGSPLVTVTTGNIMLDGEDITHDNPDVRAKKGLYLGFQHPVEISGVNEVLFLRSVLASKQISVGAHDEFRKNLENHAMRIGFRSDMLERGVNEGFSGGEKKRNELFQLSVLKPHVAIMDEIDSGLDVDGIQMAARELQDFAAKGGALLVITHAGAIARMLNPIYVYIMKGGKIIATGDNTIIDSIEKNGFESI